MLVVQWFQDAEKHLHSYIFLYCIQHYSANLPSRLWIGSGDDGDIINISLCFVLYQASIGRLITVSLQQAESSTVEPCFAPPVGFARNILSKSQKS